MKKFIILLLLCIMPATLILTACKEDNTPNVTELYDTYLNISNSTEKLTRTKLDQKFHANTSLYIVDFSYSLELQEEFNKNAIFQKIDTLYSTLLEDVSSPIVMYGQSFTSNNLTKSQIKNIYSKLDELRSAYKDASDKLQNLESTLSSTQFMTGNLTRFLHSYETVLIKASNLSNTISSLYFNNILTDPNPNYVEMTYNEVNLRDVAVRALNRYPYYTSIFADIYINIYMKGNDIPERIVGEQEIPSFEPYTTLSASNFNSSIIDSLSESRERIVDLARSLYLAQNDFDTLYQRYKKAISNITYVLVTDTSSDETKGYKAIVDQFIGDYGITYNTCDTFIELLTICYKNN